MGGREHGAREDERMCVYYGFTAGGPAQRSPGRVHAQRQTNIDEKVCRHNSLTTRVQKLCNNLFLSTMSMSYYFGLFVRNLMLIQCSQPSRP